MSPDTRPLRLGILGMSEGNGHPYSWSAIFNGYDPGAMATCPFPVIPQYLSKQRFPADAIADASVTHVWAEQRDQAEHIAAASLIPNVVDDYRDMIGEVDAILLARDDAERHAEMSIPFLRAGLPVYIDKPIALSIRELDALYAEQRTPGQIFSCSAMRYAAEFRLSARERAALGAIRSVRASTPNTWRRYGVHAIDAVLTMFDLYAQRSDAWPEPDGAVETVRVNWPSVSATLVCTGAAPSPIAVEIVGEHGTISRVFTDTFAAFKRALEQFVSGVRTNTEVTTKQELTSMVSILERGLRVH